MLSNKVRGRLAKGPDFKLYEYPATVSTVLENTGRHMAFLTP